VSGSILVVDDELEMCEAIAAGLDPRGFDVRWETSGEAALTTLAGAEVDVVLTDLNMRGMDGLAVCERIVASRPDVPVVVITAFGSLETAIAAIRAARTTSSPNRSRWTRSRSRSLARFSIGRCAKR